MTTLYLLNAEALQMFAAQMQKNTVKQLALVPLMKILEILHGCSLFG